MTGCERDGNAWRDAGCDPHTQGNRAVRAVMGEDPVLGSAIGGIEDAQPVEPAEILFVPVLRILLRDHTAQRDDRNSLGAGCCQRAQRILDGERALAVADEAGDARHGFEDGMHIVGRGAAVTKYRRAGRCRNTSRRTQREFLAHHRQARREGGQETLGSALQRIIHAEAEPAAQRLRQDIGQPIAGTTAATGSPIAAETSHARATAP